MGLLDKLFGKKSGRKKFDVTQPLELGDIAVLKAVRLLRKHDVDNPVRWEAAESLGKLAKKRDKKRIFVIIIILILTLKDEDRNVRWNASRVLVKIGEPAIGPLIATLRSGTEWMHYFRPHRGIELVKTIDPNPMIREIIIQDLENVDRETQRRIQRRAAEVLEDMGESAVEPLIQALKDDYTEEVVEAIVKIGAPAIEPLTEALKDDDKNVQEAAKEALEKIKENEEK